MQGQPHTDLKGIQQYLRQISTGGLISLEGIPIVNKRSYSTNSTECIQATQMKYAAEGHNMLARPRTLSNIPDQEKYASVRV